MLRFIILCVFFLPGLLASAQTIDISILNSKEITSVSVSIKDGKYYLKSKDEILGEYRRNSIFYISRFGDKLQVRDKKNFIGNFEYVELDPMDEEGVLSVKPVNPMLPGIAYDDALIFRLKSNGMQVVNRVNMEKYIAAVIEAEGGNGAHKEYYKAQAVLIRTFTIKNIIKHAEEGFNLCDEVHCQAYKGRATQNPEILEATKATTGMVLMDTDSVLIMSPFHSNCGGETSSSGIYWQKDLPYLQSIKDPFCLMSSQATWEVTIDKADWLTFIDGMKDNDIDYKRFDFTFNTPHRSKFVLIHGLEINLRQVRESFGLKSSYFDLKDDGKKITFHGRGYGHGIGMCQQGAMEMAKVDYTWMDILHFYFHNVSLADYREMELHRFKPE